MRCEAIQHTHYVAGLAPQVRLPTRELTRLPIHHITGTHCPVAAITGCGPDEEEPAVETNRFVVRLILRSRDHVADSRTGHQAIDGFPTATPTSARPRESNASQIATPQNTLPVDLSKADMLRFGVVQDQEKLPSGVTFASDKLSKPRIAKSQIQTEKIVAILSHAGVQDMIPLATTPVIEQFEKVMSKVHALLDARKLKEKEEQELKVREAEGAQ